MGYVDQCRAGYWGNQYSTADTTLGTYTNTNSYAVLIKSIRVKCGKAGDGVTYTWGSRLTGNGANISAYLRCAGVDSDSLTITNNVGRTSGSGGWYTKYSDCIYYTFTWSNAVVVQPGASAVFNLQFLYGPYQNVFCIDHKNSTEVTTTEYNPYYTVSYNANGGSGSMAASNATYGQNFITRKNAFTRTGHNFNGYNENAAGTSVAWGLSSAGVYESGKYWVYGYKYNITLYAQWLPFKHTVSYNANGGSGAPSDQTKTYGSVLTLSSVTPTRSGHVFKGWNTNSSGTGTWYSAGGLYGADQNGGTVTLYAIWQATYTVSYSANGGSGAPGSQTKYHNQTLTLTNSKPTGAKSVTVTFNANGGTVSPGSSKQSCTFSRWNTAANGGGTNYYPGGSYTANASATLYAQWSSIYVSLPTPTRSKCDFVGWFTATYGGSQVTNSTAYANNTTIYARWAYHISYNLNGGNLPVDEGDPEYTIPDTIKPHAENVKLTGVVPSKSGKKFLGWSTSSTATSPQYGISGVYSTDAPATLYAVWGDMTYTVTFDLKGGTYTGGGALTQTVKSGGNATLPNTPTRQGYTFQGWSGQYTNIQTDTTIYAIWNGSPVWIKKSDGQWHKYVD